MRVAGLTALVLLAACGSGRPPAQNKQEPVAAPLKAPAPRAKPAQNNIAEAAPQADPGLAAMSPSRRRAYERGFADCRAGRYDPDRYPESYRIGCAAAHDSGPAPR